MAVLQPLPRCNMCNTLLVYGEYPECIDGYLFYTEWVQIRNMSQYDSKGMQLFRDWSLDRGIPDCQTERRAFNDWILKAPEVELAKIMRETDDEWEKRKRIQ
jgi:hypothetical protein